MGIDTKKSAARAAKVGNPARSADRSQVVAKRPSTPPPAPAAKKREKSVPPPALAVANDNNDKPNTVKKTGPTPIGRGRLPTGSLHTEAREPAQAETIKQRLTALVNAQQKLADLKRSANKNFYEIGELLHRIREQRLFEVKGYGSFEAYLDREVNLGQQFCLHAVRIYELFLPNAAASLGFARLSAAVRAIDDEPTGVTATDSIRGARSPIPPHKL